MRRPSKAAASGATSSTAHYVASYRKDHRSIVHGVISAGVFALILLIAGVLWSECRGDDDGGPSSREAEATPELAPEVDRPVPTEDEPNDDGSDMAPPVEQEPDAGGANADQPPGGEIDVDPPEDPDPCGAPNTADCWISRATEHQNLKDWRLAAEVYLRAAQFIEANPEPDVELLVWIRAQAAILAADHPSSAGPVVRDSAGMQWLREYLATPLPVEERREAEAALVRLFDRRGERVQVGTQQNVQARPWIGPDAPDPIGAVFPGDYVIPIGKCPEPNDRWLQVWVTETDEESEQRFVRVGWVNRDPINASVDPYNLFGDEEGDAFVWDNASALVEEAVCSLDMLQ